MKKRALSQAQLAALVWAGVLAPAAELLPGDLGFMAVPGTVPVNHTLLYAGRDAAGNQMWVHCSASAGGVVLNSPTYVTQFRRATGVDLETEIVPARDTAA